ncbi:hypothetical protein C8R42DRAFT_706703 [Lentinula raphanica]|nr:hypothetical protein C8R42DRAFT_706703 [Lentinula raphanica]
MTFRRSPSPSTLVISINPYQSQEPLGSVTLYKDPAAQDSGEQSTSVRDPRGPGRPRAEHSVLSDNPLSPLPQKNSCAKELARAGPKSQRPRLITVNERLINR